MLLEQTPGRCQQIRKHFHLIALVQRLAGGLPVPGEYQYGTRADCFCRDQIPL